MGAVWMRLRAEWRERKRAWIALALLFGIAGGAAVTAAAGARRAESAYPRFIEEQRGYDVTLGGMDSGDPHEIAEIRRRIVSMPQVLDWGHNSFVSLQVEFPRQGSVATFPDIVVLGDPRGREGYEVSVARPLAGRLPDPSAPDQAMIDWLAADRLGIEVGDRALIRLVREDQERPTRAPVRVVGITIAPGSMPAVGQATFGQLTTTPAFLARYEEYLEPGNEAPSVRLRGGVADVASFVHAVESLPVSVDIISTLPDHLAGVRETLRFEVVGLWLVSAFIALAAIAVLGQALARETASAAADTDGLSALGMSRRAIAMVGVLRAAWIAGVASVVSVGVAFLASPLTPVGLSRLAEPTPGLRFDGLASAVGAVTVAASIITAAMLPSWRSARISRRSPVTRPSRLADSLASASAPLPFVSGTRLALDPGRGSRATPVRSAVLGSLIGSAVFIAAMTFSASLHHLVQTPELYGFNWDLIGDFGREDVRALLDADPDVEVYGRGGAFNVMIGEHRLIPFTYETGVFEPTMLTGRAPRGATEIALGPKLLEALDRDIGDRVEVIFGDDPSAPKGMLTIVGGTVVPAFMFQAVLPGQGAALPLEAIERIAPDAVRQSLPYTVRFRDGVDIHAKLSALADEVGFVFAFSLRQPGGDLLGLSRVEGLPIVLAAVLGAIAVATLTHTLVTSIRRRRRDLALLKTIGSIGRQLRATIRWQASILTFIAVVIGVPLGIVGGRWLWSVFSADVGVINAPRTPVIGLAIFAPASLLLANLIAAVPGRVAARTQPALVLRSE